MKGRSESNSAGEEERKRVGACDLAERMRRDLGNSELGLGAKWTPKLRVAAL